VLKYLTNLLMKHSRWMSCYFAPSMTFRHMVTYQSIVLRVIKHVHYAKKTPLLNNWNMEGRQYISGIGGFLEVIIPTRCWKKRLLWTSRDWQSTNSINWCWGLWKVKKIDHTFDKSKNKSSMKNIWKTKSIFFNLSYWSKLEVRQCVMHVEKNVWDNLIDTLLNINGKIKDGLNARLDLIEMNIQCASTPIQVGKHTYLPPTCYTMSKDENK